MISLGWNSTHILVSWKLFFRLLLTIVNIPTISRSVSPRHFEMNIKVFESKFNTSLVKYDHYKAKLKKVKVHHRGHSFTLARYHHRFCPHNRFPLYLFHLALPTITSQLYKSSIDQIQSYVSH